VVVAVADDSSRSSNDDNDDDEDTVRSNMQHALEGKRARAQALAATHQRANSRAEAGRLSVPGPPAVMAISWQVISWAGQAAVDGKGEEQ